MKVLAWIGAAILGALVVVIVGGLVLVMAVVAIAGSSR